MPVLQFTYILHKNAWHPQLLSPVSSVYEEQCAHAFVCDKQKEEKNLAEESLFPSVVLTENVTQ